MGIFDDALSDLTGTPPSQTPAASAPPIASHFDQALEDLQRSYPGGVIPPQAAAAGPTAQPMAWGMGTATPAQMQADVSGYGYDPGRAAARAATFGLSDKVAAAIDAGSTYLTGGDAGETWRRDLAQAQREHEIFSRQNPGFSTGLDIIGSTGATAPLMPVAAATLPGRIVQGVGYGGLTGGAAGYGESPTGAPGDILRGAGAGAVTGGALPPIAAAGMPILRGLQNKLPWAFPNAIQEQAQSGIRDLFTQAEAVGDKGIPETLAELQKTPSKPLSIGDVGPENLQAYLGTLSRQKAGRALVKNMFTDRDVGAGQRLLDDIDTHVSNGDSAYQAIQNNLDARSANARPLYEALFAKRPIVASDRIQQFTNEPIIQQGLAEGMKLQRLESLAEGHPFNPNDYRITYDDSGTPRFEATPNLRTLDAAKRGLDSMLSGDTYRDSNTGRLTQMGVAINKVRGAFVNELDNLTGGPAGDYAQARAVWAGPSRANEMIRNGQSFLGKDPGEIGDTLAELTPTDREFWQLGAADKMRSLVNGTGFNADEAKKLISSQGVLDRLRPMFDSDDTFNGFVNNVMAEKLMKENITRVIGGSQTAPRLAADVEGHGAGSMLGSAAIAGGAILSHEPAAASSALYRLGRGVASYLQEPSEAVKREMARMLTRTTLPENQAILQGIAAPPGAGTPFYEPPLSSTFVPRVTPGVAGIAAGIYPGTLPRNQNQ